MKNQFILISFFVLYTLEITGSSSFLFGSNVLQDNQQKNYTLPSEVNSSPLLFSQASEESLYIKVLESGDPDQYLQFLGRYPQSYFGVLAGCRYLLLELERGAQLEILINNLNAIGFPVRVISLYPLIRGKPEHLQKAVIFTDHKLQMILRENYSSQLKEDPQVRWYVDFDKLIDFPFDALHLAARRNYFRVQSDHLQYLISDSLGLQRVQKIFHRINYIMDDLSRNIGYASTDDLFSQVLDREYLMYGKLSVFVYDARQFKETYHLVKSGWSYPLNGLIFIDSRLTNEQQFLEQLIHQISHIFIAGNLYDIHHSACRWFDEGFAQWAARCYVKYQTLQPIENSYQQFLLQDDIHHLRLAASEIWSNRKKKKIKFSTLNKQLTNFNNPKIQQEAETLSLSLIAYLVETFGSEKLLQVAGRISRVGQNYSERSLYYILGWEYADIQKGWNEWLRTAESSEQRAE